MKPQWLEIAEGEIGVHEVDGAGNNPRILEYHEVTTLQATTDLTPWCSSFVCWCFEKAGLKSTRSAAAKSWLDWGEKLEGPRLGCVCVIHKGGQDPATGSASGYHVGFWVGEKDGRVNLLGGNQSDQVKYSSFGLGTYEIVGYRWPLIV